MAGGRQREEHGLASRDDKREKGEWPGPRSKDSNRETPPPLLPVRSSAAAVRRQASGPCPAVRCRRARPGRPRVVLAASLRKTKRLRRLFPRYPNALVEL